MQTGRITVAFVIPVSYKLRQGYSKGAMKPGSVSGFKTDVKWVGRRTSPIPLLFPTVSPNPASAGTDTARLQYGVRRLWGHGQRHCDRCSYVARWFPEPVGTEQTA